VSDELAAHPICQVCGDSITENIFHCPACETLHHQDCWEFNNGCSTYACKEQYQGLKKSQETKEPEIRIGAPPSDLPERLDSPNTSRWKGTIALFLMGLVVTVSIISIPDGLTGHGREQREIRKWNWVLQQTGSLRARHDSIGIGTPAENVFEANIPYIPVPGSHQFSKGQFVYPKVSVEQSFHPDHFQLEVFIYHGKVVGSAVTRPYAKKGEYRFIMQKGTRYLQWEKLPVPETE